MVYPVPEDQSYPEVRRAVLGVVPAVDLAVVAPAVVLAWKVAAMVLPEDLPGRGSTVASDTAAEFRPIAELEFARLAAC